MSAIHILGASRPGLDRIPRPAFALGGEGKGVSSPGSWGGQQRETPLSHDPPTLQKLTTLPRAQA
jgi:hypothetical protein